MGYAEADVIGVPLLSFVHPEDAAVVSEAFARLLSGQAETAMCEYRTVVRDGTWRWLELQITNLLDDPDFGAILCNYRNITQRRRHEEMAQCLAAYLACPEYAMSTEGLDGVILDWNPGAERAFGYCAEEIVGQNISLLIPSHLRDQEAATRAKIAEGQDVPQYTTTHFSSACGGDHFGVSRRGQSRYRCLEVRHFGWKQQVESATIIRAERCWTAREENGHACDSLFSPIMC